MVVKLELAAAQVDLDYFLVTWLVYAAVQQSVEWLPIHSKHVQSYS